MATLNILSADLVTRSLVITRNNPAPVYYHTATSLTCLDTDSKPVGVYRNTRPVIHELSLDVGLSVLVYTDGLTLAGDRVGKQMDIGTTFEALLARYDTPQDIADGLLEQALDLDQGRPVDDISILVLQVCHWTEDEVRRMSLRLPFGP